MLILCINVDPESRLDHSLSYSGLTDNDIQTFIICSIICINMDCYKWLESQV